MADPSFDELLAGALGMGDQEQAFALQMANAQKLRDQARAPQQYRTPGAALGGAISQGLNNYQGTQMMGAASQGMAGIGQQRRALIRSLPDVSGPTAASLSGVEDDGLAQGLTGVVEGGIQKRRALDRALAATGDKTLTGLGAQYGAEAKADEAGLFKAAEGRETRALRRSLGEKKIDFDLKKLEMSDEWKRMDNTTKLRVAEIMGFKFIPTPGSKYDGYVVSGADKNLLPIGERPVDANGQPLTGKGAKPDDPEWLKFVDKTEPTLASSRTALGQYAGIKRQVNATKALYAPGAILTPQQLSELGIGLARTVGGQSGATHRGTIQDVAAKAFGVDATKFLQYFSGKPEDIPEEIKGPWAKHFMDVLTREEGQADQGVNEFLTRQISGKADVVRRNLRLAVPLLQQYGFTEKQINDILAKSAPPTRAPAAAGAPLNVGVAPVPAPGAPAAPPAQPATATPPAGTPPRADGKIRIKRNGQPGWILPGDVKPGDERI